MVYVLISPIKAELHTKKSDWKWAYIIEIYNNIL
jgi:hypothetical protein